MPIKNAGLVAKANVSVWNGLLSLMLPAGENGPYFKENKVIFFVLFIKEQCITLSAFINSAFRGGGIQLTYTCKTVIVLTRHSSGYI